MQTRKVTAPPPRSARGPTSRGVGYNGFERPTEFGSGRYVSAADSVRYTDKLAKLSGITQLRFRYAAGPEYVTKEWFVATIRAFPNEHMDADVACWDDEFSKLTLYALGAECRTIVHRLVYAGTGENTDAAIFAAGYGVIKMDKQTKKYRLELPKDRVALQPDPVLIRNAYLVWLCVMRNRVTTIEGGIKTVSIQGDRNRMRIPCDWYDTFAAPSVLKLSDDGSYVDSALVSWYNEFIKLKVDLLGQDRSKYIYMLRPTMPKLDLVAEGPPVIDNWLITNHSIDADIILADTNVLASRVPWYGAGPLKTHRVVASVVEFLKVSHLGGVYPAKVYSWFDGSRAFKVSGVANGTLSPVAVQAGVESLNISQEDMMSKCTCLIEPPPHQYRSLFARGAIVAFNPLDSTMQNALMLTMGVDNYSISLSLGPIPYIWVRCDKSGFPADLWAIFFNDLELALRRFYLMNMNATILGLKQNLFYCLGFKKDEGDVFQLVASPADIPLLTVRYNPQIEQIAKVKFPTVYTKAAPSVAPVKRTGARGTFPKDSPPPAAATSASMDEG